MNQKEYDKQDVWILVVLTAMAVGVLVWSAFFGPLHDKLDQRQPTGTYQQNPWQTQGAQ